MNKSDFIKTILVLINKDDDSQLSLITDNLEDYFFNVEVIKVFTTKEAFKILNSTEVDLIIYSVNENNIEYLIKNELTKIPLLLVSTNTFFEEIENKVFKLPPFDFLTKPIKEKLLVSKINNYFKIYDSVKLKTKIIDENIIYSEIDLNGIIKYVSQPLVNISGFTKNELITQEYFENVLDISIDEQKKIWESIQNSKTWMGILKKRKKNDEHYIAKTTITPLYENGILLGYYSHEQDVTSEISDKARMQEILDAQYSLIIILDNKVIIESNKTLFYHFGYKNIDDFKSKHKCICDLFIQENESSIMPKMGDKYWVDYVMQNNNLTNKAYLRDKNENIRIYDVHYRGKISNNQYIIVFTDITQLEEKSEILSKQSRLAAMGEMISMIAHQWRQPLTAISGLTTKQNLKKRMNQETAEDWQEFVNKHKDLVNYMSKTIDDFRYFFKEQQLQSLTIENIINKTYKLTTPLFEKHNVEYKINYKSDGLKDVSILTASSKLDQVFINLYKNALDEFISNKKQNPKIWVNCEIKDEKIVFEICDNAGGIPEDILSKIFDPYFSTKSDNGTGLGLYMSKTIIEEHLKGSLEAINKNAGACFTLKLPII
ncbi:ATP-binding protein [Candidatus Sulfurimonas baltica]|uniref:histidine kinase n=1 Tax=Candidatus Sulfurimonas baltica TaxID=2740404 RepID=A0A7S7LWV6_9BACT|nr:ATP-binding protein [Candidatus Sulfurimonas baltica]QOY52054.1 PAS domain S-box protein [Candidatus Sulfurimonas baltica]